MYQPSQITTTVPDSNNRARSRRRYLAGLLVLIAIGLLPASQALPPPPPGGAYPGFNTALGFNSLKVNSTGQFNTAIGFNALQANTTGNHNTAFGLNTLLFNTTGTSNMGIGGGCLRHNLVGNNNTAIGYQAMSSNLASSNVAIGYQAMFNNTTTEFNVALGDSALFSFNGTTAFDGANTALGSLALEALTSGQENVAVGRRALEFATSGSNNVVVGWRAGDGLITGSLNTFIGDQAGKNQTNVSNVLCIQSPGDGTAFTTPDRTFIGNIRGVTVGNGDGIAVFIDSDGQLGTVASSRRFKKEIKSMDQTSEAILALKPVTFHYKNQDTKKATNTPQFGLIAEDVAEVNPDLVIRNADGELMTVRYDAVNVMLLNEFLKEHKKVEKQHATIAELKSTVAQQQKGMDVLTAQLKEQAAQIQKVSARLDVNKPAPKVAANR